MDAALIPRRLNVQSGITGMVMPLCKRYDSILPEKSVWGAFRVEGAPKLTFRCLLLDCALNLVRTQASCTDVDMARGTVNNRLDALDVGLPCSVRTSMGVGNLDAERYALAANIAFCHQLHLLAVGKSISSAQKAPTNILAEVPAKCKHNFQ